MTLIKRVVTEENIVLFKYHLFGRLEEKCDTVLYGHKCSRIHAAIEFKGEEWILTDMSTNGTLVNNILVLNKSIPLRVEDVIRYSLDPQNDFIVVDLNPPTSFIVDENKDNYHNLDNNFLELKDGDESILFFQTENNLWNIEIDEVSKPLVDKDTFSFKDKTWTFFKYEDSDYTYKNQLEVADFEFYFEISPNYEHVFIKISVANEIIELPPKAMNYTLYLLAKQQEKDIKSESLTQQEYGWIDNNYLIQQLSKEMGNDQIDIYYLNVQVFRLRKAFSKTNYGPTLNGLIERRSGQIRFKHENIKIKEYASIEV